MGKGCGCAGIAVFLLIGVPVGLKSFSMWRTQREEAKAEEFYLQKQAQIREDVRTFADRHAPDLLQSLQDLEIMEAEFALRVEKLEGILRDLNRDPQTDPDYRQWRDALINIRKGQESLRNDIHEAYLAYRKFELSPDPELEAAYKAVVSRGKASAQETRARYDQMRREL